MTHPELEAVSEARLAKALADLTDCFLEKHGCFPLDNPRWKAAMSEAYALIGQPGTPQRTELIALRRSTALRAETSEAKPVAWLHTLHMELGQKSVTADLEEEHPFGESGEDYDPSYYVTSEALYASPPVQEQPVGVTLTGEMVERAKSEFRRWGEGYSSRGPTYFVCREDEAGETQWLEEFAERGPMEDALDDQRLRAALLSSLTPPHEATK
jgi:hypothetical protein